MCALASDIECSSSRIIQTCSLKHIPILRTVIEACTCVHVHTKEHGHTSAYMHYAVHFSTLLKPHSGESCLLRCTLLFTTSSHVQPYFLLRLAQVVSPRHRSSDT